MRFFNDIDFDDFKGLPRIRFKGGSTTTQSRTIPSSTLGENMLQDNAKHYADSTMQSAETSLSNANSWANNYNNVANNYNTSSNQINNGYKSLLNGNLPSTYAAARQQALNSDLTGTVGSAVNSLASRGIINSSSQDSNFDSIIKNASDTLAKNFSTDMNNYSGLLGNASANNTSNLNNYTNTLSNLVNTSDSLANNTSDLFNTMYSGRMGTGGTTQTTSGGGNGVAQVVGSIGSALICFASGTKIDTPTGDVLIENIAIGDKVYSLDDDNNQCVEEVIFVNNPFMSEVLKVTTDNTIIKPTFSQRFLTNDGFEYIEKITTPIISKHGTENIKSIVKLAPELVYDFTTTGRNIFFANGLAVEGLD